MNASSDFEVAIINIMRGTTPGIPASLAIGLFTSDPKDDFSGTEVGAGVGYSPQAIQLTSPVPIVGTGSSVTNTGGTIIFGPCTTTDWGLITHWVIRGVGGTADGFKFLHGEFLTAKNIAVGDSYTIPDNTLDLLTR